MRISKADNIAPDSSPPLSQEKRKQYVWSDLAPRLIDPTRLAIMEALIQLDWPMTAADLVPVVGAHKDLVHYHCRVLVGAGVLEAVDVRIRPGRKGDEAVFDFPPPPPEPAPSSSK